MGKRRDITVGDLSGGAVVAVGLTSVIDWLTGTDLDRRFSCTGKVKWAAILPATKAAYALSEARGYEFQPYRCRYCHGIVYHIGRKNMARRPE